MTDLSEAVNAPGVTDSVYDNADGILYLSTASGDVLRWDPSAGAFLSPIYLGGDLTSVALTPDGSSLLVGDEDVYYTGTSTNYGHVDRVSLSDLSVTTLSFPLGTQEEGVTAITVAANGEALITSDFNGSGWVPLREFLATGSKITDATVSGAEWVAPDSRLITSDHGRYIFVQEDEYSPGTQYLYDSQADKIVATSSDVGADDINEEDGLLAGGGGSSIYLYDLHLNPVRTVFVSSSADIIDVHFSADGKELFAYDGAQDQIDIFSTTSWSQTGTIQLTGFSGAQYSAEMTVSADGRFLFVQTDGALESIDLSANPTSTPSRPSYQADAVNGTPVAIYGGNASFPSSSTTTKVIGNYVIPANENLVYDQSHSPAFTLQSMGGPTPYLTIEGSVQLTSSTANLSVEGVGTDSGAFSSLIKVTQGGTLQVQESGAGSVATGASTAGSVENDGMWSVSAAYAYGVQGGEYPNTNFTNSGTFTVTGTAGAAAGVVGATGTSFTNTGTFSISGYAAALGFSTSASEGTGISNGGNVTVTSETGRAVAFELTGFHGPSYDTVQFVNSGTITAATALLVYNSSSPAQSPTVDLYNSGTINGDIDLGIGDPVAFADIGGQGSQVINTGAINGAIHFDDGDDLYNGLGGTQTGGIYLGAGTDRVVLGNDGETVYGGSGVDDIIGGAGNNVINGDPNGRTTFSYENATAGVTVSLGISGPQNTGGAGTDTLVNVSDLVGSNYNDVLTASGSGQTLEGGGGNDTLIAGTGNEVLDGGSGIDTVILAGSASGYTVTQTGVYYEAVGASGTYELYNDEILQFTDEQMVLGSAGETLTARAGGDVLIGGAGNDTLVAGTGADSLNGGGGTNMAVFSGDFAAYTVAPDGSSVSGLGATASLSNIQILEFADAQMVLGSAGETLTARAGGDDLIGGPGNDILIVGSGTDTLDGGGGVNTAVFSGAYSTYSISQSGGTTTVSGSGETATLTNIEIAQFADRQVVLGSAGETVTARAGGDDLIGGAGNDTFIVGTGTDTLDGGGGVNTAVFSGDYSSYTISQNDGTTTVSGADGTATLDNIQYAQFADQTINLTIPTLGPISTTSTTVDFAGDFSSYTLSSSNGVDTVSWSGGSDPLASSVHILEFADRQMVIGSAGETLTARAGGDILIGGAGADTLIVGTGTDTLNGGAGVDTAVFSGAHSSYTVGQNGGTATISGSGGTATLTNVEIAQFADEQMVLGSAGETLTARAGGDTLIGGPGNDTLNGGAGNDILIGGGGTDTLNGGGGINTAVFSGAYSAYKLSQKGSAEVVKASGTTDALTNIQILQFSDRQMVLGSAGETLTARAGGDTLVGGAGNDILITGSGNDTLNGGGGINSAVFSGAFSAYHLATSGSTTTVTGPGGTDTLTNIQILQFSDEQMVLGSKGQTLTARPGGDTLVGGAGADTLIGGTGNDVLIGGAGQDTLTGGSGQNSFVFTATTDSKAASPDLITNFVSGPDKIDISDLNADLAAGYSFHLGATKTHTGDIVVSYDAAQNRTVVDLWIGNHAKADMVVWLTGDHLLTSSDFVL